MRQAMGRRSPFVGLWGGLLLGVLVFACGPAPGSGDAGDARGPSPEEVAEQVRSAFHADSSGRSGPVSSAFDVSKPSLRLQRTGSSPAVAFDGRNFLVVWEDARPRGVFGTRVKPDGTILDPAGIPILFGSGPGGGTPRVAYDGTQFVVVWAGTDGVFGRRVSRDGKVRGPAFEILEGDDAAGPAGIACARELCLVTFTGLDDENFILGRRVLSDGTVLDRDLIDVGVVGPLGRGDSAVAWDGREFLVVWSNATGQQATPDIFGARVLPDGTVVDPGGVPLIPAPGAQRDAQIVWTGDRFLVVWTDNRSGTLDVYGARVRRDLRVEEPEGFPIATGPGDQHDAELAHHGSKSLVVWTDDASGAERIRGARVGDDGRVRDPGGFAISRGDFLDERGGAVAAGADRFFVAYGGSPGPDISFTPSDFIVGTRVRHDTRVQDSSPLELSRSAAPQDSPAVAYGAGTYLVVRRELSPDATPMLLAARVETDGDVRDRKGVRLPASPDAENPAVAFDGKNFLVVWQEPGPDGSLDIRGARVSASGRLLDVNSLAILTAERAQREPAVASSGDGFLVVWEDERGEGFGNRSDIVGTRVSREGTVLEPGGFRISSVEGSQVRPSVVHAGDHYLVAWGLFREGPPSVVGIDGARVSDTGSVLDTPEFAITRDSAASPESLSFDGENVLVAWTQFARLSPDTLGTRIRAARVGPDGSVLDPSGVTLVEGPRNRTAPAVTFDGRVHWVVWAESELGVPLDFRFPSDLAGVRVTPGLTVVDPGGLSIASDPGPELQPALASDGKGRAAVFYTEFVLEPDVMALRVRGRLLRGGSSKGNAE